VEILYLVSTMNQKEVIERTANLMAALWMLATFMFVALVLGTVGFGFVRMFFLAGAAR
jgi:hypothetical protein